MLFHALRVGGRAVVSHVEYRMPETTGGVRKEETMAEQADLRPESGSERSSAEIRDDIAARRESITQTVGRLEEKFHETMDWKAYVARHPYLSVGVALGTGLILSGIFKRRTSPTERIVDALIDKAEQLGDDLLDSARRMIVKTVTPGLFRGALYGIAGRALIQYLQDRAAHVEGDGANLSGRADWREPQRTTSSPNVS
jgi:ElaB/YqjD/DUF883 family membrane-anchored ribosome-binding protein